jgi:predicted ribosomally synthesized peptide with SipW-like signal peptide
VVTDDTVAVNWALLELAATVTLAGSVTLALLSDSVTANPPVGAAPLSVTVHEDVPGAFTLAGVQARLLKAAGGGDWMTVIVPAEPEAGIEAAAPVVAKVLLSVTGTLVLVVPAAMVKAAVATSPFPIVVVFNPKTTQVVEPLPLAHWTLLLAAEAAEPMATVTPVISDDG